MVKIGRHHWVSRNFSHGVLGQEMVRWHWVYTSFYRTSFFFFLGGGELVGSKFQKLLMKNLKYNEKVAASNLALKRIVDLYFVIHFLYPLYPKQWNVYHLQVKPLHLAVTNVLWILTTPGPLSFKTWGRWEATSHATWTILILSLFVVRGIWFRNTNLKQLLLWHMADIWMLATCLREKRSGGKKGLEW